MASPVWWWYLWTSYCCGMIYAADWNTLLLSSFSPFLFISFIVCSSELFVAFFPSNQKLLGLRLISIPFLLSALGWIRDPLILQNPRLGVYIANLCERSECYWYSYLQSTPRITPTEPFQPFTNIRSTCCNVYVMHQTPCAPIILLTLFTHKKNAIWQFTHKTNRSNLTITIMKFNKVDSSLLLRMKIHLLCQ